MTDQQTMPPEPFNIGPCPHDRLLPDDEALGKTCADCGAWYEDGHWTGDVPPEVTGPAA